MKLNKSVIISFILTVILTIILVISYMAQDKNAEPQMYYQIYLDGEKVGVIENKDYFYNLINQEQTDIKETYQVDQVYPPKGFEIVELIAYNVTPNDPNAIYDEVRNGRDFTIRGYSITIRNSSDEDASPLVVNVINREVFEEAIQKYVTTFVKPETYQKYLDNSQDDDAEEFLDNIYFEDAISIKEAYISVSDEIFMDSDELVKKLLFGDNMEYKPYKIKVGDTLDDIAYDNKLSVQELLIANDNLKSEDVLLAKDEVINIALIDPMLNLTYEMDVEEIIDEPYKKEITYDSSRSASYRVKTLTGIPGKTKITTHYKMVNGSSTQAAYIDESKTEIIREPQNEVWVYGTKYNSQTVVPSGDSWGLPTNFPYVITSPYGYRGGYFHDGIDISGTGYNSPIYAVLDGEVYSAGWGGILGDNAGYNVVIKHDNGYYSSYSHMSMQPIVKAGQRVEQGQQIGNMGHTGWAEGTHVHLGIYVGGLPYNGGQTIDPRKVILF